jgi:hypothetical protein
VKRTHVVSDAASALPLWVRRRDGSQVPFDADRICQSLFAAAESLGTASPFLMRELTDVVVHFLGQQSLSAIAEATEIAEHVGKIVREVGQPHLAKRYDELQRQRPTIAEPTARMLSVPYHRDPERFLNVCRKAYALEAIFSRDVSAAMRERLLRIPDFDTPTSMASLLVKTPRLVESPWWIALEDWRTCSGGPWTIESPEWLCCHPMHPAMTPHVCERLLSLPTLAGRAIELHLNVAEPPPWSYANEGSPLFAAGEDEAAQQERTNFLDGLLERWKALDVANLPALAWHIHAATFANDTQLRQLRTLIRLASLGKPIRFLFDRPRKRILFSEGLDRKTPGVLLNIGLDLAAFASRPDIAHDGPTLLKKLPSLVRIAVSAANQKRQALRTLSESSPLKQRFLIERASSVIAPDGIDTVVQATTGASLFESPLSLQFALELLRVMRETLDQAGRAVNLDLRLECLPLSRADNNRRHLELEGQLHANAGAGIATLTCSQDADDLVALFRHVLDATTIARVQIQRASNGIEQGVLPIQ